MVPSAGLDVREFSSPPGFDPVCRYFSFSTCNRAKERPCLSIATRAEHVGRYGEGDGLLQTAIPVTFEVISAVLIKFKFF